MAISVNREGNPMVYMNLIETVKKYQNEILDNGILVEYGLFFNEISEGRCSFAIDDAEELEELNNVILEILEKDKNAEVYVCTYSMDFAAERIHIYADSLWIHTTIGVEELYDFFRDFREIEPSDIALLSEDEEMDGTAAIVVSAESEVEDYRSFIEKRQSCKLKSLYWD